MDICSADHREVPQLSVMPRSQRNASIGRSALLLCLPDTTGLIYLAWWQICSTHSLQNRPEIQSLPLHCHSGEYWEEFGLQEKEEERIFLRLFKVVNRALKFWQKTNCFSDSWGRSALLMWSWCFAGLSLKIQHWNALMLESKIVLLVSKAWAVA